MAKKEIRIRGKYEQKNAVEYLERLLEGIKAGTFYVQNDDEYVSLTPADVISIDVEVSRKHDREKLSLELSWYTQEVPEEQSNLVITTKKPETVEKSSPVSEEK